MPGSWAVSSKVSRSPASSRSRPAFPSISVAPSTILHTSLNNRPQLIGSPYPSNRGAKVSAGVQEGPARAAFANAPFNQSVSIHRNKFYGPGFVNTDVVFQKTQTVYEQFKVVFRAESYNVLNHPNFASPSLANLVISSPNFGVSTSQVGQNDGTTGARQIQGAIKLIF